jgi:hypothetical protein
MNRWVAKSKFQQKKVRVCAGGRSSPFGGVLGCCGARKKGGKEGSKTKIIVGSRPAPPSYLLANHSFIHQSVRPSVTQRRSCRMGATHPASDGGTDKNGKRGKTPRIERMNIKKAQLVEGLPLTTSPQHNLDRFLVAVAGLLPGCVLSCRTYRRSSSFWCCGYHSWSLLHLAKIFRFSTTARRARWHTTPTLPVASVIIMAHPGAASSE